MYGLHIIVKIIYCKGLTLKYACYKVIASLKEGKKMTSFNELNKKEKLDIYSLIIDLNESGIKVSSGVNRFDWIGVHIFLPESDIVIDSIYIGGHEGLNFEEGYKYLSNMLERENEN